MTTTGEPPIAEIVPWMSNLLLCGAGGFGFGFGLRLLADRAGDDGQRGRRRSGSERAPGLAKPVLPANVPLSVPKTFALLP